MADLLYEVEVAYKAVTGATALDTLYRAIARARKAGHTWQSIGDASDTSVAATALNHRAWQLVAYVETAVRNDPSFGGLVNEAYPRVTDSTGPIWADGPAAGQAVGVTMQIHVEELN